MSTKSTACERAVAVHTLPAPRLCLWRASRRLPEPVSTQPNCCVAGAAGAAVVLSARFDPVAGELHGAVAVLCSESARVIFKQVKQQ